MRTGRSPIPCSTATSTQATGIFRGFVGPAGKNGELRRYIIDFNDKNQVPDRMTVTFGVRPVESLTPWTKSWHPRPAGPAEETFAFDITFDPAYTASGVVY